MAPFDSLNLGRSTADRPEAVAENRRLLLHALGLDGNALATAGQTHGSRVVEVTAAGHVPSCDALLTRRSGLALAVSGADCLPVIYEAPGVVAAAHAGWRGMAAGICRHVVETLCAVAGAEPADIRAHLGPAIRRCCYEVGREVASRFPAEAVTNVGDSVHLDLAAAARVQLLGAGLRDAAIMDTAACTACDPDWYFSHRRDAGRTGRQWGLVTMRAGD